MSASEHVVRLRGGEVLVVSPEARRQISWLLRAGMKVTSGRDGISAPRLASQILDAFGGPTAASAVAAVPQERNPSPSTHDLIGTAEIARMIGTKERNARDLCARGVLESAVRVGRCWFADRDEVARRAAKRITR